MEKIDFAILSSETKVLNHQQEAFVELHDNHLIYRAKYFCDLKDDDKGWIRNDFRDYTEAVSKSKICGIYISFHDDEEEEKTNWKVNVSVMGVDEDTYIFFDSEEPARDMYNKIYNWLYK